MRDDICSIPISEVFEEKDGCPICRMRDTLEERMIEYILGAAMMEPDVRIKTNELGFCGDHFTGMMKKRNRLSLGLILDSHLKELYKTIFENGKGIVKPNPKKSLYKSVRVHETCFVCDRVEWGFQRLLATVFRLYSNETDFRKLFSEQDYICLPHYSLLISEGQKAVVKRYLSDFNKTCSSLAGNYLSSLSNDVSHFCTMFDYRNTGEDADWGNSKDSIERTVQWLTANKNRDK